MATSPRPIFLSALAGRWARFFDAIKVPWVYGLASFDLGDRTRYRPDFWLPDHLVWVAIVEGAATDAEIDSMRNLMGILSTTGIVLAGEPGFARYTLHFPCEGHAEDGTVYGSGLVGATQLARCRRCDGLGYVEDSAFVGRPRSGLRASGEFGRHTCGDHDREPIAFGEEDFRAAFS